MTPRESVRSSRGDKQKLPAPAVPSVSACPRGSAKIAPIHGLEAVTRQKLAQSAELLYFVVDKGSPIVSGVWGGAGSRLAH